MSRRPLPPRGLPSLNLRPAPDPRLARAQELYRAGRLSEAEGVLRQVLKHTPERFEALYLLGLVLAKGSGSEEAERLLRQCIRLAPRHAGAMIHLANLLMMQGRVREAEPCYAAASRFEPRHASLYYNWGCCLRALGRLREAIAAYRQSLALQPDYIPPAVNLGSALSEDGQFDEAEAIYRDLIKRRPDMLDLRQFLGQVCRLQGRLSAARGHFEELLRLRPDHAGALLGLAALLIEDRELDRAQHLVAAAAATGQARQADYLVTLGALQAAQGDYAAAIATLVQAIQSGNNQPHHYLTLAQYQVRLKDREQAVATLERSLGQFGERPPEVLAALVINQYAICDWRGAEGRLRRLVALIKDRVPVKIAPFAAMSLPGLNAADLRYLTQVVAVSLLAGEAQPLSPPPPRLREGQRLRIGYLSYDFHEHATAYLTAAVFEAHDSDQFEISAYSYGPDDGGPTRKRLIAAFPRFVDIAAFSHAEAARRIQADGIDILVDLKGYTTEARPEILALRPAPIQVNWLGYPGTMAVPFMDYLIVDEIVVPPGEAAAYDEALAYLPHAYAPVDPYRQPASRPSRADQGLPEAGFVFCCFNNARKINPEVFDRWCRLLASVTGSVLWLFVSQPSVVERLREEARGRGIAPERLVFARRVSQPEHLARLQLADLVLDTRPYNAHTTAADALFMGVPVLTCPGETFASRVAASLLRAAGMPELILPTLDDYEAKARHLATQPQALAELREHLRTARTQAPYFDPVRFARDLEGLYRRIWSRHTAGLPPALLEPEITGSPQDGERVPG